MPLGIHFSTVFLVWKRNLWNGSWKRPEARGPCFERGRGLWPRPCGGPGWSRGGVCSSASFDRPERDALGMGQRLREGGLWASGWNLQRGARALGLTVGRRVPVAPRPSGQAVRPFRPRRSVVGRLGHGGRAAAVACVACHRQSGGGCARPRAPGGTAACRRRRAVGPRHLPEHRAAVPRTCLRVPPGIRIDPHGTRSVSSVGVPGSAAVAAACGRAAVGCGRASGPHGGRGAGTRGRWELAGIAVSVRTRPWRPRLWDCPGFGRAACARRPV